MTEVLCKLAEEDRKNGYNSARLVTHSQTLLNESLKIQTAKKDPVSRKFQDGIPTVVQKRKSVLCVSSLKMFRRHHQDGLKIDISLCRCMYAAPVTVGFLGSNLS